MDWLGLVGIDSFATPQRLWWLLPLALPALFAALRVRPRAMPWPALPEARRAGARRFDAGRGFGLALRALAVAALAAALAGPVGVHRAPPQPGLGLDLLLVLDASGSMGAVDATVGGRRRNRLALAREVVSRFATARAAEGDRVGLVVFGGSTFTACPLTSDGRLLAAALERIEIGMAGESTALGDALALAVRRSLPAGAEGASGSDSAGRVVVLLTDGRHNAGNLTPEVAAKLARSAGVRVHTVGIGSADVEVPIESTSGNKELLEFERQGVDRAALADIAKRTGGRFFDVRRSEQLSLVYRDIDGLERVERRRPPKLRYTARPEPLLALAGCCLLAEIGGLRVLRRRFP